MGRNFDEFISFQRWTYSSLLHQVIFSSLFYRLNFLWVFENLDVEVYPLRTIFFGFGFGVKSDVMDNHYFLSFLPQSTYLINCLLLVGSPLHCDIILIIFGIWIIIGWDYENWMCNLMLVEHFMVLPFLSHVIILHRV